MNETYKYIKRLIHMNETNMYRSRDLLSMNETYIYTKRPICLNDTYIFRSRVLYL